MLHLTGLFTHLFDPLDRDEERVRDENAPAADSLSDTERLAIGDPLLSRGGGRHDAEEPRFASLVMPPYF